MITKLLQNPPALFYILFGLTAGLMLGGGLVYFGPDYAVDFLINEFKGLAFGLVFFLLLSGLLYLSRGKLFNAVIGEKKYSLADFSNQALSALTSFLPDKVQSTQAISDLRITMKIATNYISSALIIKLFTNLTYSIFASIIGLLGTLLLVKQNEIMERENFVKNLDLPEKIYQMMATNSDNKFADLTSDLFYFKDGVQGEIKNLTTAPSFTSLKYSAAPNQISMYSKGKIIEEDIIDISKLLLTRREGASVYGAAKILQELNYDFCEQHTEIKIDGLYEPDSFDLINKEPLAVSITNSALVFQKTNKILDGKLVSDINDYAIWNSLIVFNVDESDTLPNITAFESLLYIKDNEFNPFNLSRMALQYSLVMVNNEKVKNDLIKYFEKNRFGKDAPTPESCNVIGKRAFILVEQRPNVITVDEMREYCGRASFPGGWHCDLTESPIVK